MRLLLCLFYAVLFTATLTAQRTVTGIVTDADSGDPLIGVAVQEVGTTGGTLTNLDGRYELVLSTPQPKLLFTYLGMRNQTLPVGNRTELNVQLETASELLNEVVVTGYTGTTEVKDLVGSYSAIQSEELQADRPIESVDQLLEGRIAGVRVETVTGEPGLPVRVEIRGQSALPPGGSNISPSTQPLYVLDGVPLYDVLETNTEGTFFSDFNSQVINPLALINPDDIESITVLKDASAAALYGSDASNGVVLITTKKGREGSNQVSLSVNYGTGRPLNEIQFLNTEQYLELARETLFNSDQNPAEAGPSDVSTDWREIVQQNPTNADIDLTMSGGAAGITYRLAAGYGETESVHRGNGLRQGNLNLNLQFPLGEKLRMSTRLSGAFQNREGLRSFDVFSFPPNLPVRNPDGSFNNSGFFERRPNPVALLEQNENETESINLNGHLTLSYEPLASLRFRVLGGIDLQNSNQFQYRSALNGSGVLRGGLLTLSSNNNLQWITNGQVAWSPKWASDHHVSSLLGGEARRQDQFRQVTQGRGFPNDEIRRLAALPNDNVNASETQFERATASLYGELAYDYDYRYYLKLNARRDASSIFGGDQQANVFWSLGAGWNFSAEPAWEDALPFGLDYGKLRASFGVTGNSRLGVYTTGGIYRQEFADENYGGQNPAFAITPANDLLGWERKRQTNLGLDLGWLAGRIGLTVEWYNNQTIDGLRSFTPPRESGFSAILANAVGIRNRGLEFTLRYETNPEAKIRYSTSFNAARNDNLLTDINLEVVPGVGMETDFLIVGESINLIYGIPSAGINPETGVEEFRLPDGTITSERAEVLDRRNFVPIGSRVPDLFGGWTHSFGYGPLNLTILLNYSFGSDVRVDRLTFTDGQQILFNNQSINQLDRWQQPGDITDTPQLRIDNAPVANSTRYLYSLDFVQLASVNLSFDFKRTGLNLEAFRQLRAFVLVNNVHYWYGEPSPPNRNGVAEYRFTFPQQRALTMGVKIGW